MSLFPIPNEYKDDPRNYCNVLNNGGITYETYMEHFNWLLFRRMVCERTPPPCNPPSVVAGESGWNGLEGQALVSDSRA